jgi:aspartyl-tRNA(Asn)/glutamyl-tRNA(Gln) amidotransferase subunit A
MPADQPTIEGAAGAIAAGETTAEAITTQCLERIAERNPAVNAFIAVDADGALVQAREADREIAAGRHRGPLHGIPVSLKDLIDVRGTPTTAASRVRGGHLAEADADVVARLRTAGAVVIGKTNLHEFAFGTTNEDSAFGPVRHPLDPTRSPGGSSGGSAAAVADGMCYASIGTDTGGSIRIPAAVCGLVGLKPALGDIPTGGIVPLSSTMDHAGPLCRTVGDAAIVYHALRGTPASSAPAKTGDAAQITLGVLRGYFTAMLDPQVAGAFETLCARLSDAGVQLHTVDIPHAGDIAAVYLHIVLVEAAALHAGTLESRAADYIPATRLRLEMGRYVLGEDYVRALRGREVLRHEVDAALDGCDGLLLPSMAVPAIKLGTTSVRMGSADEPVRSIMLRLTQLFNITGHPAISIPCGQTIEGLPIGAQLVGGQQTTALLHLARSLEPYFGPGMSR